MQTEAQERITSHKVVTRVSGSSTSREVSFFGADTGSVLHPSLSTQLAPPSAKKAGTAPVCSSDLRSTCNTRSIRRQRIGPTLAAERCDGPLAPGYWCVDEASCKGREQNMPQEMSSAGWPLSVEAGGIFSTVWA